MSKRFSIYLGILLVLYLVLILQVVQRPLDNDFSIMYASARVFLEGESLYTPVEIERFQQWDPDKGPRYPYLLPNLNPPFLTLVVLPLALLGYATAFWIFSLLSLLAGLGAIALVERETRSGPASRARRLGFLLLLLAFYPTYMNLSYGQLGLFLFLLIALAWSRLRRGDEMWGGIWLGVAGALKLFVGLFVLLLLVRRRIRALVWMGVTFVLCWGAGALVFGVQSLFEYRSVLSMISWSADSWNASFLGFFSRLLGGSESVPVWEAPQLARGLASAFSIASALLLAWTARVPATAAARHSPPDTRLDLSFGLTIVLMLLLSPLGWAYYFSILLLPIVAAWQAAPGWKTRVLVVGAGLLAGAPFPLLDSAEIDTHLERFVFSGVYFYGLVLLAGVLLALMPRQRSTAGITTSRR